MKKIYLICILALTLFGQNIGLEFKGMYVPQIDKKADNQFASFPKFKNFYMYGIGFKQELNEVVWAKVSILYGKKVVFNDRFLETTIESPMGNGSYIEFTQSVNKLTIPLTAYYKFLSLKYVDLSFGSSINYSVFEINDSSGNISLKSKSTSFSLKPHLNLELKLNEQISLQVDGSYSFEKFSDFSDSGTIENELELLDETNYKVTQLKFVIPEHDQTGFILTAGFLFYL